MGEFDDVLAMESGDEWDDYEAGAASATPQELGPLVGELLVPGALVHLYGDVPDEVLRSFEQLRAPADERLRSTPVVTLFVDRSAGALEPGALEPADLELVDLEPGALEPADLELVDLERGSVGRAATPEALVDLLAEHLVSVSAALDRSALHLGGAVLQLPDGSGVLVVDHDRRSRHAVVAAMVALGARCVSPDRAVVVVGSRTALAFPLPVRAQSPGLTIDHFAPAAQISTVVWVAGDPDPHPHPATPPQPTPAQRLGRPYGCARLLVDQMAEHPDPERVLHAITDLAGAVQFWSVPRPGADGAEGADGAADAPTLDAERCGAAEDMRAADRTAAAIVAAAGADRDAAEVATTRRLVSGEAGPSIVRFAAGGALVDPWAGTALELAEDELPVLDQMGWRARGADPADPAALEAVLAPLADAGIDLRPVTLATPPRVPGLESFGLPDSPAGATAAAAWTAELARTLCAAEPGCAPLLLAAAARSELSADDATLAGLSGAAGLVDARARSVMEALDRILAVLADDGIAPILLGDVVAVLDGPLPAELVPVDSIELLVAGGLTARCIQSFAAAGATVAASSTAVGAVADGADAPVAPSVLWPATGVDPVRISVHERLAGGPFGELVDHDELSQRAVPVPLGDRWARGLHPDDRFIWACICADRAHPPRHHDLRQVVLTAPRSRSAMASALETSEQWGATRTVLAVLRATDAVLPGLSPWLVERARRSPDQPRRRRRGPGRI